MALNKLRPQRIPLYVYFKHISFPFKPFVFLFFLLFSANISIWGQIPTWKEAIPLEMQLATKLKVDTFGNRYIIGKYSDGSITQKLAPDNTVIWTKRYAELELMAMDIDLQGNVYLGGNFNAEEIQFGSFTIKSNTRPEELKPFSSSLEFTETDFLVGKLDGQTGEEVWVKSSDFQENFGGSNPEESLCSFDILHVEDDMLVPFYYDSTANGRKDYIRDLIVNKDGDVFITGGYLSDKLSIDGKRIINPRKMDRYDAANQQWGNDGIPDGCYGSKVASMYVAKFSQADGSVQWLKGEEKEFIIPIDVETHSDGVQIKKQSYNSHFTIADDLAIDAEGNVYVSIAAGGEVALGNTSIDAVTQLDFFNIYETARYDWVIAKFNADGNSEWIKKAIGGHLFFDDNINKLFVAPKEFEGSSLNNGGDHLKLARYSSNGTLERFKVLELEDPTLGNGEITDLLVDRDTNVYISGYFTNKLTYEKPIINGKESEVTCYLENNGKGAFYAKFNKDLAAYWANKIENSGNGVTQGVDIGLYKDTVITIGNLIGGPHKFGEQLNLTSSLGTGYLGVIKQNPTYKIHFRKYTPLGESLPSHFELWGPKQFSNKRFLFKSKEYDSEHPAASPIYSRYGFFNPTLKELIDLTDLGIFKDGKLIGKSSFNFKAKDVCNGRRKEVYIILHDDLTKYSQHPVEKNNSNWRYKEEYYNNNSTSGGDFYQTTMFIPPGNKKAKGYVLEDEDIKDLLTGQPVVMVHGYTALDGYWGMDEDIFDPDKDNLDNFYSSDYFHTSYTARIRKLLGESHKVWEFYYPSDQSWEETGFLMGRSLEKMLAEFYKNTSSVDIVAHSMGGLVTRSYIEETAFNYRAGGLEKLQSTFNHNIKKVLFLSTPQHGSFGSNRLYWGIYAPDFASDRVSGKDDFAPAARLLGAGHEAFDKLNNHPTLNNHSVEYFQITGTTYKGLFPSVGNIPSVTESFRNDDGIVSMSSGNLLKFNVPLGLLRSFSHVHMNTPDIEDPDYSLSNTQKKNIPQLASEFITENIQSTNIFRGQKIFNSFDELDPWMERNLSAGLHLEIANPIVTFKRQKDNSIWTPKDGSQRRPMRLRLDIRKPLETKPPYAILKKEVVVNSSSYNSLGTFLYYGANDMSWNWPTPFNDFDKVELQNEFPSFYPYRVGFGGPWIFYPEDVTLLGVIADNIPIGRGIKTIRWARRIYKTADKVNEIYDLITTDRNPLDIQGLEAGERARVFGRGIGWHLPKEDDLSLPIYLSYTVKRWPLDEAVNFSTNTDGSLEIKRNLTTYNDIYISNCAALVLGAYQHLPAELTGKIDKNDFSLEDVQTSPVTNSRSNTQNLQNWIDCKTNFAAFVLEYGENNEPVLEIQQPNGRRITIADIDDNQFFYDNDPILNTKMFGVTNPMPGKWTVWVNGKNELPDSTYALSFPMDVENISFIYAQDTLTNYLNNSFSGEIILETTLDDLSIPTSNLKVIATAFAEDGTAEDLIFKDDGEGPDKVAGDKIFTGTFITRDSGIFTIVADIIGKIEGCNFIRESYLEVLSIPARAFSDDIGVVEIITSQGGCDDPREIKAVIENLNHFSKLESAQINWEINGILQTPIQWTGNMVGSGEDTISLETIQLAPNEGYSLRVWTTLPNGLEDTFTEDDTLTIDLGTRTIAGKYTLGNEISDFINFDTAFYLLDSIGICDTTTLLVKPGTYDYTFDIRRQIKGVSVNSPLIIQSETGKPEDVIIKHTAQTDNFRDNYAVLLENVSGVIFRNITFEQESINGKIGGSILINDCSGPNYFYNNVFIKKDSLGTANPDQSSLVVKNSENQEFVGNTFIGGVAGIYLRGPDSLNQVGNNLIADNIFEEQSLYGILLSNINNTTITRNQIDNDTTNFFGILVNQGGNGNQITANKIKLPEGGSGIAVQKVRANENPTVIANNAISIKGTAGTNGIRLFDNNNVALYYNTVHLYQGVSQNVNGLQASSSIPLVVKNNNFIVQNRGYAAIYIDMDLADLDADYNNYHGNNTTYIIGDDHNSFSRLSLWQDFRDKDLNSISVSSPFTAIDDLHTLSGLLNGAGTPIEGITTDFDGETRNEVKPDIGADEFKATTVQSFELSVLCDPIVQLTTQDETNSDYIVVEYGRSTSSLDSVGLFQGAGTIDGPRAYNFEPDFELTDNYYFRLKFVNLDGTSFNSEPYRISQLTHVLAAEKADLCLGESTSLKVEGALQFQWSTGDTLSEISVTPTETTTYYVSLSDGICTIQDSITIAVVDFQFSLPEAATICNGEKFIINGDPRAANFNWSPTTGLFNPNDNAVIAQPTSTTTYYYTANHAFGCSTKDSIMIEVADGFEVTNAVVNPSTPNGNDGQLSIAVNGGQAPFQYNWASGQNTASIANLGTGTYEITVTDADGCSAQRYVELTAPYTENTQCYDWQYLYGMQADGDLSLVDAAVDASGNTYLTGSFNGTTITIDNQTFNNPTGADAILFLKLDAQRQLLWLNLYPSPRSEGQKIVLTPNQVFLRGEYNTNVQFDEVELVNDNFSGHFIAAFSTDGHAQWAKTNIGRDNILDILIGVDGNLVSLIDLAGDATLEGIEFKRDEGALLLAAYDPKDGNLKWFNQIENSRYFTPSAINRNQIGDLFISGTFAESAQIGGININATDESLTRHDMFLLKCKGTDGNVIWAKSGGVVERNTNIFNTVTDDDYVYTFGRAQVAMQIATTTIQPRQNGTNYLFLSKFQQSDGLLNWVKTVEGNSSAEIIDLENDPNGNIYFGVQSLHDFIDWDGHIIHKKGTERRNNHYLKINNKGELQYERYFEIGVNHSFLYPKNNGALMLGGNFETSFTNNQGALFSENSGTQSIYLTELNATNLPTLDVNITGGNDLTTNKGYAEAALNGSNENLSYQWSNGSTAPLISDLPTGTYQVTVTNGAGCTGAAAIAINTPALGLNTCVSQGITWKQDFPAASSNLGSSVATDSEGNVYIVGRTRSELVLNEEETFQPTQNIDPFLIKYDRAGNIVYTLTPSQTSNNEGFYDVHVDHQNFVYVTGYLDGFYLRYPGTNIEVNSFAYADLVTLKLSPQGTILWHQTHDRIDEDVPTYISTDNQGNVFVQGSAVGGMTFNDQAISSSRFDFIVKYNARGDVQWVFDYPHVESSKIASDAAGNTYGLINYRSTIQLGNQTFTPQGSTDALLFKLDANGNLLWVKSYGAAGADLFKDLLITENQELLVGGYSSSPSITFDNFNLSSNNNVHSFYLSISAEGTILSANQVDGVTLNTIGIDALNNIHLSGTTNTSGTIGSITLRDGLTANYVATFNKDGTLLSAYDIDRHNSFAMATTPLGENYTVGILSANFGASRAIAFRKIAYEQRKLVELPAIDLACNGTTQLNAGNGFAAYQWSNGSITNPISINSAGWYTVTVTDNEGCQDADSVLVETNSGLAITETFSEPVSCAGNNDGFIELTVAGVAPFNYRWSNGSTNPNIYDLAEGNYTVTITDNAGCELISQIAIPKTANCIVDNDQDGYNSDNDPDDNDPCVPDNSGPDCIIIVDNDQDGYNSDNDPDDNDPCVPDNSGPDCIIIVDNDQDGYNSDNDPDDNDPCVPDNSGPDCMVIVDNDQDGYNSDNDPDDNDPCVPDNSGPDCIVIVDNDQDGYNSDNDPDDNDPCVPDNSGPDCMVIVDNDQDGYNSDNDPDDNDPCVPDNSDASCNTGSGGNLDDPIFDEYPWLLEEFDTDNCEGTSITVYQSGVFQFIFVEDAEAGALYFQNGTFYCQSSPTYDCVAAYNLSEVVSQWACSGGGNNPVDNDQDGYNSDNDPDDNDPCVPDNSGPDCMVIVDNDQDGYNSDNDPDDNDPCVPDNSGPDCMVIVDNDQDGYNSDNDPDDNDPCIPDNSSPDCMVVVDNDQDGYSGEADPDDNDPCVPDNSDASCNTGSGGNLDDPIFDEYPWLLEEFDTDNCEGTSITVYQSGVFQFIFVEDAEAGALYFQNGTFYCQSSPTYDCVAAYHLSEVVSQWACSGGGNNPVDNDQDGYNSDNDPDDNDPCVPDNSGPDCMVIVDNDQDGYNSDNDPDDNDPCIPDNSSPDCMVVVDNDQDGYSGEADPDDNDPCVPDNSDASCNTGSGGNLDDPIFDEYPWLLEEFDTDNCEGTSITVYQSGVFQFIFVEDVEAGALYFQNGTFYCQSSPTYDCVAAYNLTEIVSQWTCSGGGNNPVDNDQDGYNSDNDPDDNDPCVPDNSGPDCMVIIDNDQDGYNSDNDPDDNDPCVPDNSGPDCIVIVDNDQDGYNSDNDPDDNDPCIPDNSAASCNTGSGGNLDDPIFDEFPWLLEEFDTDNCEGTTITVYQSGVFQFIFVEDAEAGALYFQNGTFYCQSSPTYDCVTAYNLSEIVSQWTCSGGGNNPIDNDHDGYNSDNDPDDNDPCVPDNSGPDCIIIVDNDQDGYNSDNDPDDNDPCVPDDSSEDCMTTGEIPLVFEEYPWLKEVIDLSDCKNHKVTRYPSGIFDFILVESDDGSALYLNGSFYCNHTPNYNCITAYNLDEAAAEVLWSCGMTTLNTNITLREGAKRESPEVMEAIDFTVHPNPSNGKTWLKFTQLPATVSDIRIYNLTGSIVHQTKVGTNLKNGEVYLNLGHLNSNLYLIQWASDTQVVSKRLLIKH